MNKPVIILLSVLLALTLVVTLFTAMSLGDTRADLRETLVQNAKLQNKVEALEAENKLLEAAVQAALTANVNLDMSVDVNDILDGIDLNELLKQLDS